MNRKFLMDYDFLKHINSHIDLFLETNVKVESQDRPTTDIVWDTFKVYMMGIMIRYAAKHKAGLNKEINKVRDEINILQRVHKIQKYSRTLKDLQQLKLKVDSLLHKKANDLKQNSRKLNYIAANKSGKHLTSIIKTVLKRQPITLKNDMTCQRTLIKTIKQ